MIVVSVALWSAVDGSKTELARMVIYNTGEGSEGGAGALRSYHGETFRGRDTATLNRQTIQKEGDLKAYPSQRLHIWNLVKDMLQSMGYGR